MPVFLGSFIYWPAAGWRVRQQLAVSATLEKIQREENWNKVQHFWTMFQK